METKTLSESEERTSFAPTVGEYVCPMHPDIVRNEPGECPICGMALEPRAVTAGEKENSELADMKRRFLGSLILTIPVLIAAMGAMIPGRPLQHMASQRTWTWVELILASPVVLWGGWPFFVRGWHSIVNRSLNMFTLIGLGVAVSYVYSLIAAFAPEVFPAAFRDAGGNVAVYFEAGRRHRHPGSSGAGAGIAGSQPDRRGDQSPSGPRAEDSAFGSQRRLGSGCSTGTGAGWRALAGPAGRKSAGGRRCCGRRRQRRRVHDHGRADPR